VEELESRVVPSSADGNGPVVTSLASTLGSTALTVTFDGAVSLNAALSAQDLAFFQVHRLVPGIDPRLVTTIGAAVPITAGTYNTTTFEVTLTLATPLNAGEFYRVFINGTPTLVNNTVVAGSVLTSAAPTTNVGVPFDGDNDDTPTGNFYGLFAVGTNVQFSDASGDQVSVGVTGPGAVNVWRELNGDVDQLSVVGGGVGTTLTGAVTPGAGSNGLVYVGSTTIPVATAFVLNGAANGLSSSFVTPIVFTGTTLNGSAVITGASSTAGLNPGQSIVGVSLPNQPSTVITAITGTDITLNQVANLDGTFTFAAYPATVVATFTGDTTTSAIIPAPLGSAAYVITNVSSTAGLAPGQYITDTTGTIIPAGTTILSVGTNTITIAFPNAPNVAQANVSLIAYVPFPAPAPSPAPIVADSQNLPYTLTVTPVNTAATPSLPGIQSGVYAQVAPSAAHPQGLWLIFGGRTNGLHTFGTTGVESFPPAFQNPDIIVIDPATWQSWSVPWTSTGLAASVYTPLMSTNQEFHQDGDNLYVMGGFSTPDGGVNFNTYSTLTALSVSALANAVISGGNFAQANLVQITDSRFEVTGGELSAINDVYYLAIGQNFQGGYTVNGPPPTFTQTYTSEIRSFRIHYDGSAGTLSTSDYQVLRDPVNFRRRDYNLTETIDPSGQPGLAIHGGVFTIPQQVAYGNPILIDGSRNARVDTSYEQFFSQYSSAHIPLFDAANGSMYTIFLGGISGYDYDFATGQLSGPNFGLPWVDDVTTFLRRADGTSQEFIMPSQLPGFFGGTAAFFAAPGLPTYANGVIDLARINAPTLIGYMYGGIFSQQAQTTVQSTQTGSSNQVFAIYLTPTRATQIILVSGPGTGGGPQINIQFGDGTSTSFFPFPTNFTGGVRVAQGDITNDGFPDIVAGAGPSGSPEVKVYDGRALRDGATPDASLLVDFYAWPASFSGGVFVAIGDFNRDGYSEVVVGAGPGGGAEVKVYDGAAIAKQRSLVLMADFFAWQLGTFSGGVTVAVGDINADGTPDLIVGAGPGGMPEVKVYDGVALARGQQILLANYFALPTSFRGGVFVAAGDLNGDGWAEVVVGAGAGGGPQVAVFNSTGMATGTPQAAFYAYPPSFTGGVAVSTGAYQLGGVTHRAIFTGAGPGGGPQENVYDGLTLTLLDQFFAYDPSFTGGVFPAASGL